MMKTLLYYFMIFILVSSQLHSQKDDKMSTVNIFKDIYISIDSDIKIDTKSISFSKKYQDLNIKEITTSGSLDAVDNLRKSKANIAIVRGDILGAKNNGLFGFDAYNDYGIICSPSSSILYLISEKEIHSIIDLRYMEVSTGLSSNIAQLYLSNIAKNSGTKLDIGYNSLSFDDSIHALQKGQIDAIFMFAPESYASKITKMGLKIQSVPDNFFTNLTIKKGLNPDSYYLGDRRIRTLEVQNFIIAPKTTLDKNIDLKVESLISAFSCYKTLQNIDAFYGDIYPSVKESVNKIQQRVDKEDAITFTLDQKIKTSDGERFVYYATNHSSSDMNITLEEFRTTSFDTVPIKPRHLMSTIPSGYIELKAKSQKMITILYKNTFIYTVKPTKLKVIYKNLTLEDSRIEFFIHIGDR
ncbi:MAG: TAXI family TRAP transporter solute-binding subunit [Sulfurovum sp.]|nr:TAXI family TRAP transporter solute-binding subunit [Sulfurovum sp.]